MCPNTCETVDGVMFRSGPAVGKSQMCLTIAVVLAKFRRVAVVRKLSSARVQVCELRFQGELFVVVNVHRPYKGCHSATFQAHDAEVDVIKETYRHRSIIIGDFNAQPDLAMAQRLGAVHQEYHHFLSSAIPHPALEAAVGSHGHKLMNFSSKPPKNSWSVQDGVTWLGPVKNGEQAQRCYDLIAASPEIAKAALEVRRCGKCFSPTDHYMMLIRIAGKCRPAADKHIPREPATDALKDVLAQQSDREKRTSNARIRREQALLRPTDNALDERFLSDEERAEVKRRRKRLRRHLKQLERANWGRIAREVTNAADAGNMKQAFAVLNEALGRGGKESSAPESGLLSAARGAIDSLTQQAPTQRLNIPELPARPPEFTTPQNHVFPAYTDGSKYHSRRRPRAGVLRRRPRAEEKTAC